VDARLRDAARGEPRGGDIEGLAGCEKTDVRDSAREAKRDDAIGHAAREADVVRVEDEPDQRRLSRRMSGASAMSSARILKTTRGEESVETPRVRGK
jgi:hypothetical protein